jgi:hypothetical protein
MLRRGVDPETAIDGHTARAVDQLEPHRSLKVPAQLAAAGLHNREIAQHLFITARTVEGHLAHAYPTGPGVSWSRSIRLRDSSSPRALGTDRRSGAPGGRESRQAPDSGIPQCRSGRPPQLCERRSAGRCESAASVPERQSRRPPTSASPDASLLTRRPPTWQRAVGLSRTAMRPPRPHALNRLMHAVH